MKKLFITAFLFLTVFGFSQKNDLGNVTIDELKEKVCPKDTSAVAAFLFNVGKTYFNYSGEDGFEMITEITTKIKIYKKEGYGFANQAVTFYIGDRGSEKVNVSKAVTYNLAGDKIEKTKLSGDGEFTEKVNKYWSTKKIAMPNVKEGSIIEFKFVITSPYISNFPEWNFQKRVPVYYSEYKTYIPEYFSYNIHMKGYFSPEASKEVKPRKIDYTYVLSQDQVLKQGLNTGRIKSTLEFNETTIKYAISNVPALKQESYVNNIDNYRCAILHELSGVKYPNSNYENYSTDWESVVRKIYENESFGDELKKTGYFEKDLDALLSGISSVEERTAVVFNYVKSRMNWDEFYGIYCDAGVRKAYQDKKGNVAEINLMLTAMLRYAGLEANPVLVSTRSNGISIFPSRTSYNYVIAGVEFQNQVILFDATSKFSLPNVLPIRDLNWFGRIIRKDETSSQIDLMPTSNSKDIVTILATIDEKGDVTGKVRDQYFDYNAFVFRENYNGLSKESYLEKLEKRYQGLEVSVYDVQNRVDLSKPIVDAYDFTSTNSVEIIGDKMYFSPFLFFAITENPFKQESREYPVDFEYPNQDKYNISIKIPDGYTVETLPAPAAIALPDNLGSFKYNTTSSANQIQIQYTQDTNQAILNSDYYEALKNFYKEIVNKQTEKIIIKKI